MATLKALKSIPLKWKDIAFSHTKEAEKELLGSISCISMIVSYLILGYYFHGEYFEKAGYDLSISDYDKMSVLNIGKEGRSNNIL